MFDELIVLFQFSCIVLDMLVWCDGMLQWQVLCIVVDEIGLVQVLSDLLVGVDVDSFVVQFFLQILVGFYVSQLLLVQLVVVLQKSLFGCVIVGIVVVVFGVGGLVFIGILVVIVLFVYQDYIYCVKVSVVYVVLVLIKIQVEEFVVINGYCLVNDDEGFLLVDGYVLDGIFVLCIGCFDNNYCGIEVELLIFGSIGLDGMLLWLDYDGDVWYWECIGGVDDKYLLMVCCG